MVELHFKNKRAVMAASVIIGMVLVATGSFFIGYNIGKRPQDPNDNSLYPVAPPDTLAGVYKRQYYDEYNHSREAFIIFKEDSSCAYRTSSSQGADSIDLNATDEKCSYTYDEGTGDGELVFDYVSQCLKYNTVKDQCSSTKNIVYTFSYKNRIMLFGGSSYNKIKSF